MSWTISASGTADELRQAVRNHEDGYLRGFPQSERLLAHHVLGHALTVAEEHDRERSEAHHYVLVGNGSEHAGGGWCEIHVALHLDRGSGS